MKTNIKMPSLYYEYLKSPNGKMTTLDVKNFHKIETKKEVQRILLSKK